MKPTLRFASLAVGVAALSFGPLRPASADHNFEMPSGNISCEYNTYTGASGDSVVGMGCIVYELNLGSAADGVCEEGSDRVVGFLVSRTGRASYGCFDPTEFETAEVLAYGRVFRKGGVTCTSRKTGLTCKNLNNRGFAISRGSQRLL